MAVVIDFCREPSVGVPPLRSRGSFAGWEHWVVPDDTKRGDVAVLYAGGRRNVYVGTDKITSSWLQAKSGEHKGEWYVYTEGHRLLSDPVPAGEVEQALGLRRPKGPAILSEPSGTSLLQYLRSHRRPVKHAIEGILTESRRTIRSRSRALRDEKLRNAGGICEACQTDYSRWHGLDATRVLTVHHRQQVSAFDEPRVSSLEDLAVLCANCHMLVHEDQRQALGVEELARRLTGR